MEILPEQTQNGDSILEDDMWLKIHVERDSLMYNVKEGLAGKNIGVHFTPKSVSESLYGFQRGRYYLIGAESGAGKTTLGDEILFSVYDEIKGNAHTIIYYSFEISKIIKRAKYASRLIYKQFNHLLSPNVILGIERPLTSQEFQMVLSVSEEVDSFFKTTIFIDDSLNPTGIYKDIMHQLELVGEFEYEEYIVDGGSKKKKIVGYHYHDPNHRFIVMIDHIALAATERGLSMKEVIDKISEHLVYFRNRAEISPIVIQQFSTNLTNAYRNSQDENTIAPNRLDFGDSKYTYRDADVVFGLVDPLLYDVSQIGGYNANLLNTKLRALYLIKNRYGGAHMMWPLLLSPYPGIFHTLPKNPTSVDKMAAAQLSQTC